MGAVSTNKTALFTGNNLNRNHEWKKVKLVAGYLYFNSASERKRGIKAVIRKPALIPL